MRSNRCWWLIGALATAVVGARGVEVALLPPVGDAEVAGAIRAAVAEIGLTVSVLEPAQLIDPARFSPAIYAMVVLVGGEQYPDTVIEDGDAAAALRNYVTGGGSLLVAAGGMVMSWPQRWNGSEWRSIRVPLRRVQLLTQLGLLDAGLPLETRPPAGSEFAVGPDSPLAGKLPDRFALPDLTKPYRPIPSNQEAGIEFRPIATLVDPQGGTYGAGLAQVRRPQEVRGSVFYAWAPLLTGPQGKSILLGLLAAHARQTMTPEQAARRDKLLAQIEQLQAIHRQAAAVLPPNLQTEEIDGLRARLQAQNATLGWLTEACQAGNLSFVALRLQALADELAGLPATVGQAVDKAIAQAVSAPAGARVEVPLEAPRSTPGGPTANDTATEALAAPAEPRLAPAVTGPAGESVPPEAPREAPVVAPLTSVGEAGAPGAAGPVQPAEPPDEMVTSAGPVTVATPGADERVEPPPARRFETDNPVVELVVKDRGSIFIELLPADSPRTASAFLYLVRSGFYQDTYFHRRVERFVVQGGDPFSKTLPPDDPNVGTGGPEWSVPGEFSKTLTHQRGTVGLARAHDRPNSGGSQFYICLEPQPTLDREYAIFGRVIEGLAVVDAIQVGDRITGTAVVQGADAQNPADATPLGLFEK